MAEVLGTIVGVVSLGLQVCAGINTYLNGVQCRKEDLSHTARCCKYMQALLKQIESLQNRISATIAGNRTAMEEAIAAAKAELSLLDGFVGELCTGSSSSSSRSAMERIKDQQKRFLYPFRKDHLYRLNERLETANGALHSALQLAELEVSLNHGQALLDLQANLESLTQGVSNLHLDMKSSVRQMHSETTASHSALVNVDKNSDETTSILAMAHKETISSREDLAEVKTMLVALMSSDNRAVLPKLLSKPDALRKISDITGNSGAGDAPELSTRHPAEHPLKSRVYPEFQCTCNPRRVSKSKRRQIGLAFMEQERVTDIVHAPRCPFACFNTQSNDKWSFGISVKALRGILHAGLTISMSANFGAGGFGLSPSFTYFHVREDSPAIRVLYLLERAFCERLWSDEEADHLVRRAIKTLQVTMTARKWSPFDVDCRGSNVLWYAAKYKRVSMLQGDFIRVLAFLLSVGVPRDRPDDNGFFPFHFNLKTGGSGYEYGAEGFDLLWPDGLITIPFLGDWVRIGYPDVDGMEKHKAAVTASAKMRKLYEGHLLQAIIQKSRPMLSEIINEDLVISELSDMDAFGYKMLHYLLGWPEGLRIVVDQCGDSVLQLDDQRRIVLLECALRWSEKICMSSNVECCSQDCTCAEAVKQILEAERGRLLQFRQHEHWVLAMLSASVKARDLVIDDLRRRRHELKELGLLHLSPKQIERTELRNSKVLDYYTGEVFAALKTAGICVPPRLDTEIKAPEEFGNFSIHDWFYRDNNLVIDRPLSSKAASIYHILVSSLNTGDQTAVRTLASSLYSKGFRDIDVPDCAGVTPLAGKYFPGPRAGEYIRWNWATSIESWLIEHGAYLETQILDHVTGYTTTHHLFAWIGFQSGFTKDNSPFKLIHSSWEARGGFTQKASDTCRCHCSTAGCNPYNIMWKVLLRRFLPGWEELLSRPYRSREPRPSDGGKESRHDYRQRLISFILQETLLIEEACELPRPVKSICLRACTFAMLPLRHTCCEDGHQRCDDEETRELWEEDEIEIDRLEVLMDEFEKRLEEMDCGLAEFYQAYWINRMDEILCQIDEQILTALDIEDTERLGVRLTVETEASGCEDAKFEYDDSLEYWVRQMDDVVG